MLDWSFPLYRLWRIQVRMHWFYPPLVLALLYQGAPYYGLVLTGIAMMLLQVLVHEYGHCWAARRVGGDAEKILIWPLGGLSFVTGAKTHRDGIFVSFMGPAINSLFALGAACALAALGLWRWEYLDPLHHWYTPNGIYWQDLILITFKLGMMLTLFNLCIPAYPLDGGSILIMWLSERYGRERGAKISVFISIPIGLALCAWAMMTVNLLLLLIGLDVLFQSWQLKQMADAGALGSHPVFAQLSEWGGTDPASGAYGDDYREAQPGFFARWRKRRRDDADRRRAVEDAILKIKVDAVLEKVSREGIGSLTPEERRVLDEASKKLRDEG